MKHVTLKLGNSPLVALIDRSDAKRVRRYDWYVNQRGYVFTLVEGVLTPLHRFITNAPRGFDVDHRNFNALDNRRENLRVCTRSQNTAHTRVRTTAKAGFRGVEPARNGFFARIKHQGVKHYLGYFPNAKDAAHAYDAAAVRIFGEFATLNFAHQ